MRKALVATLLALAAVAACTRATAPTAHDCIDGTWSGSGQKC
jgi:hypothetical protein